MLQVQITDLVEGISRALDSMTTDLANHHRRTAIIALRIAETQGFSPLICRYIRNAALLHDIGALLLRRDVTLKDIEKNLFQHAVAGWTLLSHCKILAPIANMVLYHHTPWHQHTSMPQERHQDARYGALLNLADTVDIFLRKHQSYVKVLQLVNSMPKGTFVQEDVDALNDMFTQKDFMEYFKRGFPKPQSAFASRMLDTSEIVEFSSIFSYVIDSRSPSTATHTVGVAEQSRALYALTGASEAEINDLYVAGLLHDIGKMGVPVELIEKKGMLTPDEYNIVQQHASISRQILVPIPGLEKVGFWASAHHERLDGKGYPNGLSAKELPLEARVIAIADILTALTEDRPYRKGLLPQKAFEILTSLVDNGGLDGDLVSLVHDNLDFLEECRRKAQGDAASRFQTDRGQFQEDIFDSFHKYGESLLDVDMYGQCVVPNRPLWSNAAEV